MIASEVQEFTLPGGDWPMALQMAIVFPLVWACGSLLGRRKGVKR